ncbi:MAG: hypothetical protein K9H15_12055 [Bacteroidales bacterium]|nr:hypothetical protein [Bacteroidales bacterium]MCF8351893.1 hypothetical protein [Bacteroidales bacterium]
MKLIDWNTIRHKIIQVLNISDKETYLSKLICNFEKQNIEQERHPFKITDIREKGFIVKIYGLFGYISFNHMPWKYISVESWKTVFPYLKGKILFGKTFKFEKEPLSIILDGDIPQFKKTELSENMKYTGIIINKTNYGIFVDIGYNFKWECGSIVGLLHKSNFENEDLFKKSNPGETIDLVFWGYNENEQPIFGQKSELKEWFTGEIEMLIDEILPVKVIKSDNGVISYQVEDKYDAILQVTQILYPDNRTQIKSAIRKLQHGDIIHCKIIKVNRIKRTLHLIWESIPEIEGIISRNITIEEPVPVSEQHIRRNRITTEDIEKLELIGKTVEVEVIEKQDQFGRMRKEYLVDNKYYGTLHISNDAYKISNKEKKQIEKNLQEGEILDCEILDIENNAFRVKWSLKDEELIRFLNE